MKSNNSFSLSAIKRDETAALDPVTAFQQAVNKTSLSPEWKEHIDRLEIDGDQKIGQVMPLTGYDRVDFPFVIGITMS